ncbi:hypothetical protein M747DRAFT_62620 [Aspergillus niger ATCC 13496]|uniref:Uncharacterized protein n=1 Tax=Aspergillus niger ATCC 13496 TaxID=1353008 RepID=A0A370BZ85_ASPNG|nr:hypothetical protein M747DRAFT_62620 [Aspergillus niger ATCC 13496]
MHRLRIVLRQTVALLSFLLTGWPMQSKNTDTRSMASRYLGFGSRTLGWQHVVSIVRVILDLIFHLLGRFGTILCRYVEGQFAVGQIVS